VVISVANGHFGVTAGWAQSIDRDPAPALRLTTVVPVAAAGPPTGWAERMVRALSDGLVGEVADELVGAPAADPVVRLLRAEVRLRTFTATVPDLADLRGEMAAGEPQGGPRTLWASAILAEHLLVCADPLTLPVATSALAAAPAEPLPTLTEAYARARLLRAVSLAAVVLPPDDGAPGHHERHDEAVALLLRCGLRTEVAVTCAMYAVARAIWTGDDPEHGQVLLDDARRRFPPATRSLWPAMLDYSRALIALLRHDVDAALAAIDRLERAAPAGAPGQFPAQGRAYLRLLTDGPGPDALEEVRRAGDATDDPQRRALFFRHVAALLADLGHPGTAEFGRPALALPPLGPVDSVERRLFELRLEASGGAAPLCAETVALLERLAAAGRVRPAAIAAVQLAHDAHRLGATATAATLHTWGVARLPPPGSRTPWETMGARPPGAPRPGIGCPPTGPDGERGCRLRIDVLRPDLRVEDDGRPVALAPTAATLLVALVHAHPAPRHAEALHEILWPDRSFRPNRLNTLVHRLRAALGGSGAVVVREGSLVRLDASHCTVDLWEYRRRLGDPATRARAITAVQGNLCAAQLPYNEHLVDARHELVAEWLRHARNVLRDGAVEPADLAAAAAALEAAPVLDAAGAAG
jgi:hypothetical protein